MLPNIFHDWRGRKCNSISSAVSSFSLFEMWYIFFTIKWACEYSRWNSAFVRKYSYFCAQIIAFFAIITFLMAYNPIGIGWRHLKHDDFFRRMKMQIVLKAFYFCITCVLFLFKEFAYLQKSRDSITWNKYT